MLQTTPYARIAIAITNVVYCGSRLQSRSTNKRMTETSDWCDYLEYSYLAAASPRCSKVYCRCIAIFVVAL